MNARELFLRFDGRINRQPFWLGVIVMMVVEGAVGAIFQPWVAGLFWFVLLYPWLAIAVKRCHDRDKTGWWCLLLLIPVNGVIWAVIDLGILKGTDGDNMYGPDPLQA